ncbi:hypothetical protein PPL_09616 [Heterostelium album PN500]|uniref:B box-type domain-containing protein n=1 Tax=Heterostelium pallidum (strain ATCC 26659 / Pp 5 / PN500) TaxID=670386 RepID=D3BNU5_HETP5|nr:hypothetical protein PPL_09616 [Heterostelium album PN500]EFA76864.1 hypothetical protein PPL_09616 [Heterostelium album PN500]|eukprot:XP_020428996.1 hypothetical protein PPL_09616 [Heterostelium album PN500]
MTNCTKHKKILECICHQCNDLMCSLCILEHWKQQSDHYSQCEHIDQIKHSLKNILVNNVKEDNSSNNDINDKNQDSIFSKTITSIWESLKSSTTRYRSLSATENEISQHFEQLHQYLIKEEHKLKKSIINDKDTIINQIDKNIDHLKHLINIININNMFHNNNNDNNCDNNDDSMSIIEDKTSQYSSTTIMKSVLSSSSLASFIKDNNQTLFNDHHALNTDELLKQNDNDSSTLLLDIIHKYNNKFNKTTNNNNNLTTPACSYELSIKPFDFNKLNSMIEQSIKLLKLDSSTPSSLIKDNNTNKSSYIFSTHLAKGATLINTTDKSVQELNIDFNFNNTYQSIVSIGEYIYIFGGSSNKWLKFSVKSKSIAHIGDIEVINCGLHTSVCYDGLDHIYLVDYTNRIDRFNIKTMKFERYQLIPDGYKQQVSTMIYKGSLYSVSYTQKKLFQLDLANGTIIDHQINIVPYTACHDNNGNFFIYSINRLTKYNVESRQSINLEPITTKSVGVFLMYHQESSTSSFIYSFGGVDFGNYRYSIESNNWEPFLQYDKLGRNWTPSVSVRF